MELKDMEVTKLSSNDLFDVQNLENKLNRYYDNVVHVIVVEEKDSKHKKETPEWKDTHRYIYFNNGFFN